MLILIVQKEKKTAIIYIICFDGKHTLNQVIVHIKI